MTVKSGLSYLKFFILLYITSSIVNCGNIFTDSRFLNPGIENYEYEQVDEDTDRLDAEDPADVLDAATSAAVTSFNKSAYIWQGMRHEWLRTVVGFKVPHRISRLASYINNEVHAVESGNWLSQATFNIGQNTGVDGNFMDPEGYYQAVYHPELAVARGYTAMTWTDNGSGGTYPQAVSTIDQNFTIDLTPAKLGSGALDNYTAIVRGFNLNIECDDNKQSGTTCNSNGMWPYLFEFELDCNRLGTSLNCTMEVDIRRAWTPEKGGLQPFETKPFDDKLNFDLKIYYTVLGGNSNVFSFNKASTINRSGKLRDDAVKTGSLSVAGNNLKEATVGIRGITFELSKFTNKKKHNHLGRYLGTLDYRATPGNYSGSSLAVNYRVQTWAPDTVHNSGIDYQLKTTLLEFGNDVQLSDDNSITGELCSNSKDNAPLFSKWQKCGSGDKGPAQDEIGLTLHAP